MVDIGYYHKNPEQIQQLVDELYANYPRITLPPEYAYFVENDLLRLLIRLARYKFVARLIKKTDRVLEVGCGSGLGCMFLSQNSAQVTGIDVNKTEIEEAQAINRRSNAEFKLVDLFQLEDTEKYDVVVSLDVIEHMPVEQGHQLVKKMVSHLLPTGMLVIGTPSIYSYEYQSEASKASHVKCYDQEELLKVIETYCGRAIPFAMNDELVHTGYSKMAWYYFVLAFMPQLEN